MKDDIFFQNYQKKNKKSKNFFIFLSIPFLFSEAHTRKRNQDQKDIIKINIIIK